MKLIFIFTLLTCNISFAAATTNKCGEISQITGLVDVLRAKTNIDSERVAIHVTAPFEVLCTDIIVTRPGSRAKVKLDNGIITMSPNSRMSIAATMKEAGSASLINLTFGKIRTFFQSKSEDEKSLKDRQTRLRVKTPSAVVGVRGTDFYVGFDPNKDVTIQATLKGEVEVEQIGSGQKAVVGGGSQVEVEKVGKEDLDKVSEIQKSFKSKEIKKEEEAPKLGKDGVNTQDGAKQTAEPVQGLPKIEDIIKPLQVVPIEKDTVVAIRQTSPLVKLEEVFNSREAVKILGNSEKWSPAADEIPGDLKDIKNVF